MRPLSGLAFDYDADSVEWLDGYINRQHAREDIDEETVNGMVSVLGSYLGECIRHTYGGEWRASEYGWGIFFDATNAVYPISKTRKQFENGEEDSIYGFFKMIPAVYGANSPLLEGQASPLNKEPKKPLWKFR